MPLRVGQPPQHAGPVHRQRQLPLDVFELHLKDETAPERRQHPLGFPEIRQRRYTNLDATLEPLRMLISNQCPVDVCAHRPSAG